MNDITSWQLCTTYFGGFNKHDKFGFQNISNFFSLEERVQGLEKILYYQFGCQCIDKCLLEDFDIDLFFIMQHHWWVYGLLFE
jgi:hypothetical protein